MNPAAVPVPPDKKRADDVALAALAELAFACEQRYGELRSPDSTAEILAGIEKRIAPLIDALLMRGPHVIDWLAQLLPTASELGQVCAVAVVLLDSRHPAGAAAMLAALQASDESKLRGLHLALRRGPIDLLVQPLRGWLASGLPPQAAAATEVLAFHRQLPQNSERLSLLRGDADTAVRRAAWRATALVG